MLINRLLSHRVRGFGLPEGTIPALRAALRARVPFIEIDTRLTADGQILVFHDARLEGHTTGRGYVRDYHLANEGPIYSKVDPAIPIPTLGEFLRVVAGDQSKPELLLDIKDLGSEDLHCKLIREAQLIERAWIISWFPEVLLRTHAVEPGLKLGFSHIPLTRFARATSAVVQLARSSKLLTGLGATLGPLSARARVLKDIELHLNQYEGRDLGSSLRGTFPLHFLSDLPTGSLGAALRSTSGGVGLPLVMLTPDYVAAARAKGFRSYVFTVDSARRFRRIVRKASPDIVFSDRAATIATDLRSSHPLPTVGA